MIGHVVRCEAAGVLFDVDIKEDLHQHIAKLFLHQLRIVKIEGLGGLVSLFQEVAAVAFMRLLTVPRAAARRAQNAQDVNKVLIRVCRFLRIIYHNFPPIARHFSEFP